MEIKKNSGKPQSNIDDKQKDQSRDRLGGDPVVYVAMALGRNKEGEARWGWGGGPVV